MKKIFALALLFLVFNGAWDWPWKHKKQGKDAPHAPTPVYSRPHPKLRGAAPGERTDLYSRKPRPTARPDRPIIPKPSSALPFGGASLFAPPKPPATVIKKGNK